MESYDGIVEIDKCCYLDTENHSLTVQFERVSITLHVDEFLDFYNIFEKAKAYLISSEDYVLGETMSEPVKNVIVPKPTEDEYT